MSLSPLSRCAKSARPPQHSLQGGHRRPKARMNVRACDQRLWQQTRPPHLTEECVLIWRAFSARGIRIARSSVGFLGGFKYTDPPLSCSGRLAFGSSVDGPTISIDILWRNPIVDQALPTPLTLGSLPGESRTLPSCLLESTRREARSSRMSAHSM